MEQLDAAMDQYERGQQASRDWIAIVNEVCDGK
jgi:hypothetical protein